MTRRNNYFNMTALDVYGLIVKGELKVFPAGYLNKSSIKQIVRHVILNVHKYTREDVIRKVNKQFFMENHLGGTRKFFDYGYNEILVYSFPEWDFKYWEFKKVSPKFWDDVNNQKELILWICEKEGLDYIKKDHLRQITAEVVQKYAGNKPYVKAGGLYELLSTVTNGEYKKWELIKMVSWSKQDVICATKWLIEEKLKLSEEQVCSLKVSDFADYNLYGMLQRGCNNSILAALEFAYPGKYYRVKSRGIILKE